ncbi:MAG: zinc-ribbon domain-containing protein [Clostridia bacterium]|nr:zinc-ribbon domain-containing protein [Clostridia bacterium]
MFCNNCGAQIAVGAKFCNNCGAPVPEQPASAAAKPAGQPVNMTEKFIAEKKAQKAAQNPQGGAYYPPQGGQNPQGGAYYPPQGGQNPQGGAYYPPQGGQNPQGGAYYPPQGGQNPQGGAYYPPQGGQPYGQQGAPVQNNVYVQNNRPGVSAKPRVRILGLPVGGFVGIAVGAVLLIVIICVAVAVNFKKMTTVPPNEQSNVVESVNPAINETTPRSTETEAQSTEADIQTTGTAAPTTAPDTANPTTAKPSETAAQTEPPIDTANTEDPQPEDFAWYDPDDPDAIPQGAVNLTTGEEIGGRWKACYFYPDAVRELAAIDIWAGDRAVTVDIHPQQINYDDWWESEADMEAYSYNGALDAGTVTAYGDYGQIYFYTFFRFGAKQYALATVELYNGGTGYVALVRP